MTKTRAGARVNERPISMNINDQKKRNAPKDRINDNLSHEEYGDNTSGLGEYDPMKNIKKPLSDY